MHQLEGNLLVVLPNLAQVVDLVDKEVTVVDHLEIYRMENN
jgi:hypothetical protein